ncbi:MAG: WG repeat-containing protein [Pedobacter sp.]|nr:MAG: WG repeat-containing protein [Pedobacter sp.]
MIKNKSPFLILLCTIFLLQSCQSKKPSVEDLALAGSVATDAFSIDANRLYAFSEGFAIIEKDHKQALIKTNGETLIPFGKYSYDTTGYVNGMCIVYQAYRYRNIYDKIIGFIDAKGSLAVPYRYVYAGFFSREYGFGRMPLPNDDRPLHLIDNKGKDLGIDLMSSFLPMTKEGKLTLAAREFGHGEDRRYKFVDFKGNVKIQTVYLKAHDFSEGLAAVKCGADYNHGKWGFINEKGETVIPFIYDHEPGDFNSGRALVKIRDFGGNENYKSTVYGYIDSEGKLIPALEQSTKYGISGKMFNWTWTQFNNGFALCGDSAGAYNDKIVMDVEGRRYDYSKIKDQFSYNGQMITFSLAEHKTDYFGIDGIVTYQPLPINGPGIPIIWRTNNSTIVFKKGIMSPEGHLLIPPIFDEIGFFDKTSGLAHAKFTDPLGKITDGYIDTKGIFKLIKK